MATAGGKQVAGCRRQQSPRVRLQAHAVRPVGEVIAGRPAESTGVVCQKSLPLVRAACSATVSSSGFVDVMNRAPSPRAAEQSLRPGRAYPHESVRAFTGRKG